MVSMARPFLADAEFVDKAARGRADEINTCIACNQACLDHIFERKIASCLVNPRACRETEIAARAGSARRSASPSSAPVPRDSPARRRRPSAGTPSRCSMRPPRSAASSTWRGGSPARRSSPRRCATSPMRLAAPASTLRLGHVADASTTCAASTTSILATGIVPRTPAIPGIEHPKVASYVEIVDGRRERRTHASRSSAPAASASTSREFLTHAADGDGHASTGMRTIPRSTRIATNGASTPATRTAGASVPAKEPPPPREVWLLQRKAAKVGDGLAKTTGWIRRTLLKKRGVAMLARRRLRAHRRCGPAHPHRWPAAAPRRRHDRHLRRAGAAARARGAADGGRHRHHADRWRGRRCRTRRQARDRAGDAGRARALIPAWGSGAGCVCAPGVRNRRLTGPGANALEDILPEMFQSGSLAAPPVTAVAHARAHRILPHCAGQFGVDSKQAWIRHSQSVRITNADASVGAR